MKPALLAFAILLLLSVIGLVIYGVLKEKYTDKLDYQTDETGGLYSLFGNAYIPFPSGELTINPLYTSKKRINYDFPNIYTDIPEGLYEKGNFNAVYTPDLQWCKNGNCSDNKIFYVNAGELYRNTSGKMFVSQDPQRASQLELDTNAYVFMNPDGSVCGRSVKVDEKTRVRKPNQQKCLSLTIGNNFSFSVDFIGLTKEGILKVIGNNEEQYPLYIHIGKEPILFKKGEMIPTPSVNTADGRVPFAVLLDDCSFAVYNGNGKFQYQASL